MSKTDKEFDLYDEIIKVEDDADISSDGRLTIISTIKLEQFIKDKIKEITDKMIGQPTGYNVMSGKVYDENAPGYDQKRQEIIKIRDKYI